MVDCSYMQVEQGELFIDCVNEFVTEGLNKGALVPEGAMEKVEICAHLLMHGQGYNDNP